ncbi:MAG: high-potential iron-sulfur protein [Neisseriaceae bacterium]|nr:high-potential iron-sulfur protein [Neisseriaceae bacterium]
MTNRRTFLFKVVPAVAAVTVLGRQAMALPPLSADNNPAAKALGYVPNTAQVDKQKYSKYKDGQKCANCTNYTAINEQTGTCTMYKGFEVNANGWCNAWAAKA